MSDNFQRAKLIEMEPSFENEKDQGHQVEVQFNPESLKLTFANQLVQPEGGDQASGNAGRQFVGAGTTKLALMLWFDVSVMEKDPVDDVRRLTQKVLFFMTPKPSEEDPDKLAPPALRFSWGSFVFDGMVEGVEETIELFSPEGKALRASMSLTLSQQKILESNFSGNGKVPELPGRKPLNEAKDGDSIPKMAAKKGKADWQSIAAANGIEDPLRPSPGQFVDLNAGTSLRATTNFGAGASFAVGAGLGATARGLDLQASADASTGFGGDGQGINTALGGGLGASFDSSS